MNEIIYILLGAGVFAVSALATRFVLMLLQKHQVMDIPNARSNHAIPVPRGGGIALVVTMLIAMLVVHEFFSLSVQPLMPLFACVVGLALVSFYDDLKGLSILWRFGVQIVAVIIGVYYFPQQGLLFQGFLPPVLDMIVKAGIWLWFINLYNFMDGIDGLAGSETVSLGIGIALVAVAVALPFDMVAYGVVIAAAALGFLMWNWHPAKIFMGDVGSVPLGFVLGGLLLRLATEGFWAAALILPAYYLIDSTYTLLSRAVQGKRFWESHSEHFYQQAVRAGNSHARVTAAIIKINIACIGLALLSTLGGVQAAISIAVTLLLVLWLLIKWKAKA